MPIWPSPYIFYNLWTSKTSFIPIFSIKSWWNLSLLLLTTVQKTMVQCVAKAAPNKSEPCLFQTQWIHSVLFHISEVNPARWPAQLQIGRDSCPALAGGDQDQAVLQCWPAQLRQLWWKALSCPPGHPTMCCGVGAQLCWLEKASAHLTKLEKRFSSKLLLFKLCHSMWTIMTSPTSVYLLLWFQKRKNKWHRTNGSRYIDIFDRWWPTVCIDHVQVGDGRGGRYDSRGNNDEDLVNGYSGVTIYQKYQYLWNHSSDIICSYVFGILRMSRRQCWIRSSKLSFSRSSAYAKCHLMKNRGAAYQGDAAGEFRDL